MNDIIEWTDKDPLIKTERKDVIVLLGDKGGAQYRSVSDLLSFYYHSHHINFHQHRAGDKFFKLWHYTILRDRYVKCNYGAEIKGDVDHEDIALIPHEFLQAKMAINNPYARLAVFDVCCSNVTPGRRKMDLLRQGLDDLIQYFKKVE